MNRPAHVQLLESMPPRMTATTVEPLRMPEPARYRTEPRRRPAEPEPTRTVNLPIALLTLGESPRLDGQDEEHIARLADLDGPFPPILVDRRTLQVIDGTHRLLAAVLRRQETIEAELFDGTPADAFLRAVQANVTHGFPLTQADRRKAAARIIFSHPHMSDRAIAKVAGLGAKTVAAIRRQSGESLPPVAARVGRDGRVRPLDAAEGRRRVAELLAENPSASLRRVARDAGVSPATAGDVRKRLASGEFATPTAAPRTRAATAAQNPDVTPALLLEKLLRDPSLRQNEMGRHLLALLRHSARGAQQWTDLAAAVPAHCTPMVRQLAQQYTQMWAQLAESMTDRATGAGAG